MCDDSFQLDRLHNSEVTSVSTTVIYECQYNTTYETLELYTPSDAIFEGFLE